MAQNFVQIHSVVLKLLYQTAVVICAIYIALAIIKIELSFEIQAYINEHTASQKKKHLGHFHDLPNVPSSVIFQ